MNENKTQDLSNGDETHVALVDQVDEGRIALHQLEKHLRDAQRTEAVGDSASIGSNRQFSLKSERSMLDQTARDMRLHYRKDSPLGLTVEELDDRGLLEGGSVPNYYSSIRQRTRRPLEMKKRGMRMQDRNNNKLLNGVYHMMRVLVKRGLRIEEYCRQYDTRNCGTIDKKRFNTMIRNIGLPLTPKEILEVTARYAVSSTEMVDFEALLRDANVGLIERTSVAESGIVGQDSIESLRGAEIGIYTGVLIDVKRMLIESVNKTERPLGDVYRMFSQWDSEGSGTVTAAQFLRVLARLHIDLSDQDQDFLVELMDTNAQGRINFESLLSFCFAETVPELGSPNGLSIRAMFNDEEATHGGNETLSAVSYEGLAEQQSTGSVGREAVAECDKGSGNGGGIGNVASRPSRRPHTAGNKTVKGNAGEHLDEGGAYVGKEDAYDLDGRAGTAYKGSSGLQRPVTALARVNSQDPSEKRRVDMGSDLYMNLPDDIIINDNEEDAYAGSLTPVSNLPANFGEGDAGSLKSENMEDEGYFGSPQGMPSSTHMHHKGGRNGSSLDAMTTSHDVLPPRHHGGRGREGGLTYSNNTNSLQSLMSAPDDHLNLLAKQTLSTLREMIISRQRTGKSLQEIIQHFDRDAKGYFDVHDFIRATSDLRIETSERVAVPAMSLIAIDGIDKATLGEFVVFVTDSDHKSLEHNVRMQVAALLERESDEESFRNHMYDVFWQEDKRKQGQRNSVAGTVSTSAFISALGALDLHLSISEVDRLIARFDLYGTGACSVDRFMGMVSSGELWQRARDKAETAQRAKYEAQQLRQELNSSSSRRAALNNAGITEQVISMAEYLGICVLGEQHLLWIAADALKAPLPVSWSSQKDSRGRTYFYNHLTNESTWDHPLDPHFRQLIASYREGDVRGIQPPVSSPPGGPRGPPPPRSTDPEFMDMPSRDRIEAHRKERPRSALPTINKEGTWQEQQQQRALMLIQANHDQKRKGITKEQRAQLLFGGEEMGRGGGGNAGAARPSSAPHHIRKSGSSAQPAASKKSSSKQDIAKAYGQQYFNLSHYKQNGYKVEEVERRHRELRAEAAGGLGVGTRGASGHGKRPSSSGAYRQSQDRAQSSGATRRPNSGSATGRHTTSGSRSAMKPAYADFDTYERFSGEKAQGPQPNKSRASVVDRALYGEAIPTYLQPKKKSQWVQPVPKYSDLPLDMAGVSTDGDGPGLMADQYDKELFSKLDSGWHQN